MKEYDVWFELWVDDDFEWQFVADFDTRDEADNYVAESELDLDLVCIKRVRGQK